MSTINRRRFLTSASVAVISPGFLLSGQSAAADMPRVDPEDAQAKALSYVHASPKADANCANCRLYTGDAGDWGPCAIFPGKHVAAAGWCSAWVEKAG